MTDALIMAAGMGTRMLPLTKDCAKPLVPLCGTTMIETVINALNKHNVYRIFIVVGYLKEQFNFLTTKYPGVTLIENKEYQHKNNISSVKAAASFIGENDCFICEADLFISDASIFSSVKDSCYFGRFVSRYSDDWVFKAKADRIVEIKKGGDSLYNMTGVSFWRRDDLNILLKAVHDTYQTKGHEALYWDEVVNANLDKLLLTIKPVQSNQIIEIDTVSELEEFKGTRG